MTKTKTIILCILSAVLASVGVALADYSYTQGSGSTVFSYTCFSTKICPTQVISNSSGTEILTSSNPGQVTGANGTFPATQSGTWNITNVSGTVSLPTGAATAANQATANSSLATIATNTGNPIPLGTSGGITPLKLNALSNTAVAIKASAGQLFMLQCGNTNSSEEYIQIYNIAQGSVTVGTSAPTLSIPIAATSTGGFTLSIVGLQFGTAISAAATTTATGGSAPSTALDCNAGYN